MKQKLKEKVNKKNNGITLIALVITIIVLLILAGVSIAMLTGQNGILNQAQNAAKQTEIENAKEQAQMDILAWQSDKLEKGESTDLSNSIIKEILTGKDYVGIAGDESFTTKNGGYEIPYSDLLYNSNKAELPEGLQVGSTVYYNPDGTYEWKSKYCSSPEDKTYQKTLDSSSGAFDLQKWRVFDINETTGEIKLVSIHSTQVDEISEEGTVYLKGAQGYNNSVQLLNEACSNLYSDKEKGIIARNININDIEKKMKEEMLDKIKENSNYEKQVTNNYLKQNSSYPIIYAKERLACIDGNTKDTGIGLSEQYENRLIEPDEQIEQEKVVKNGETQAISNIKPYRTNWKIDNLEIEKVFKETENGINYYELLIPQRENTHYWIASRDIGTGTSNCGFGVCNVYKGDIKHHDMFYSGDYSYSPHYSGLFPIITLKSDILTQGTETDFIVK